MKKKSDKTVIPIVIATGIASVATQLLTIREFLAQFSGNEFVIAFILFSWLVLGGIGTLFARIAHGKFTKITRGILAWLSVVLAALSPLQILIIRELRDIVFIHGSSVGFYSSFLYIFITIAPYCLLVGFLLPFSLFHIRENTPDFPPAHIYIADNIGDVAGGALFSFALVYIFTPLQAAGIASLPLLLTLIFIFPKNFKKKACLYAGIFLDLIIIIACVLYEPVSLAPSEGDLAWYKESRYGRIEIHKDADLYTLFSDGTPAFSTAYQNLSEEAIHYPLSQLKGEEKNILLISAQSGMMEQVAKHNPGIVDYVEIDPEISAALFRHKLIKKIPALNTINQDGREYLSHTNKVYDAIILNLPEPATFQINRFFTDSFFSMVKNHLSSTGIFSLSVKGYENYLSKPQQKKVSSLFNTASPYFNHILLLPGEKIFFLCSSIPLNPDIPALLNKKEIKTDFISRYFYGNLTTRRINTLNNMIDASVPTNQDMSPRLITIMFSQWFEKFSTSPFWFYTVFTVFFVIIIFRLHAEEFVLFSTGCMTMGTEIMVIFAFQIYFGYIYHQIGIIVTIFLAGLLPGAWFGNRLRRNSRTVLVFTDIVLILLAGSFIPVLSIWGDQVPMLFFIVFGFLVSAACGCQFPVALSLKGNENPAAVRMFSADLMGAAFGTIAASVILIPYAGIGWTAAALVFLKIASLAIVRTRA